MLCICVSIVNFSTSFTLLLCRSSGKLQLTASWQTAPWRGDEDDSVSTNDILISAFFRTTRADILILLMETNMEERVRVEGANTSNTRHCSSVVLHNTGGAAPV